MAKKYLVVYSYESHSYRYEDMEPENHSGVRNKIVTTDEDVFTQKMICKLEDDIGREDFYYPEYLDKCCIINIVPLND